MTPLYLQGELKKLLSKTLKLQSTAQDIGFNVYQQNLPSKLNAKDDSMFPYCLISLGDGEQIEDSATQDVVLTFGVKDIKADYQGYRDIANAIESVRQLLIKEQVVAQIFQLKLPIKWTLPQTEEVYPYYFGAIVATYELPLITPTNQYT